MIAEQRAIAEERVIEAESHGNQAQGGRPGPRLSKQVLDFLPNPVAVPEAGLPPRPRQALRWRYWELSSEAALSEPAESEVPTEPATPHGCPWRTHPRTRML